jgi:hypothetical protein
VLMEKSLSLYYTKYCWFAVYIAFWNNSDGFVIFGFHFQKIQEELFQIF